MARHRLGPLSVAAAFAILLTGVLATVGRSVPATGCTSLVIASSEEKSTLLRALAGDYQRTNPSVAGRCVTIDVRRVASGQAEQALARGWKPGTDGPYPDVWSPAALTWTALLSRRLANAHQPELVPSDLALLFKSPLVIGMPRPMAQALGWPDKALGWTDIFQLARDRVGWSRYGHPEWGAFQLGKTDPEISTSGLHALMEAYFAASGQSSDLTTAAVDAAANAAFVGQVESAVVHYGNSVSTFLLNLRAADDAKAGLSYISAIAMEEKELWDYNHGNPLGDATPNGQQLPPRIPLVAVYPKEGTLAADHPYVVLKAPWVTDAQRQVAQAFLTYLQQPAQQQRFKAVGFRDQFGRAGPEISASNGLQAERPGAYLQAPPAAVVERIQQAWPALRKRAKILLVFDVSSSTTGADPKALSASLATGLGQLAGDDLVASWEFGSTTGAAPFHEVLSFGPLSQNRARLVAEVSALKSTSQPAELYRATLAAVDALKAGADPTRINAVVLVTNGHSTASQDLDLDGLLRTLQADSETSGVHLFTVAYGPHPSTIVLALMARASRGGAYDASNPSGPGNVLSAVVSNF